MLANDMTIIGELLGRPIARVFANAVYTGTGDRAAATAGNLYANVRDLLDEYPRAQVLTGYRFLEQPAGAPAMYDSLDDAFDAVKQEDANAYAARVARMGYEQDDTVNR